MKHLRRLHWGIKLFIILWTFIGVTYALCSYFTYERITSIVYPDYVRQQRLLESVVGRWKVIKATSKEVVKDALVYKDITKEFTVLKSRTSKGKVSPFEVVWVLKSAAGCKVGARATVDFSQDGRVSDGEVDDLTENFVSF